MSRGYAAVGGSEVQGKGKRRQEPVLCIWLMGPVLYSAASVGNRDAQMRCLCPLEHIGVQDHTTGYTGAAAQQLHTAKHNVCTTTDKASLPPQPWC